tara:strand:+ start:745 stop:2841 length:2097 start_codon:yes stop_codon:yes gene_type:complete
MKKILIAFLFLQNRFSIVLFFLLIIVSLNFSAQAKPNQIFKPSIPKKIEIFINKNGIKNYYLTLGKIIEERKNIEKKDKKKYDVNIIFNDGIKKELNAKINITGDFTDHIKPALTHSSLKIKLENGNIGNITRFKLLLPETRHGRADILWSLLMEELGFPTLHREIINVSLNGTEYKAIFEESPGKEFLERWGIKESPIIEFDEKEMWYKRNNYSLNQNPSHIGTKIVNGTFLKNDLAYKITNEALFNPIIQKTFSEFPNINLWQKDLYLYLNKKYGSHGLITHNLTFIYDHYYKVYYPLYGEGLLRVPKCEIKTNQSFVSKNLEIINKFEDRVKSKIKKDELCFLKDIFEEIKLDYKIDNIKYTDPEVDSTKIEMVANFKKENSFYRFDEASKLAYKCPHDTQKLIDCDLINDKNKKDYFKGDFDTKKDNKYKPFPIFFKIKKYKKRFIKKLVKKDIELNIDSDENKYFYISKNTLNLNIRLSGNKKGNIILIGNFNPNININLIDNRLLSFKDSSENYVTGCLTFLDSNFNGGSIYASDAKCEDAINIIRSTGTIDKIKIMNASSDALDLDFSKLNIKNINIKNAVNDCSDFSYGKYQIEIATLKNCGDKSVSVGEKSNLKIKNLIANNTFIGIASKDSSNIFLEEGKIFNNKSYCLSTYKKKQEFDGGTLIYKTLFCDNPLFYSDKTSNIINYEK